jgi:hypothetical protein
MCGIWAYILRYNSAIKSEFYKNLNNINYTDIPRVRGPDTTNEIKSD